MAKTKETQLTARQRRAANSKFNIDPNARKGEFEIEALFFDKDVPDMVTFPNLAAALSHFQKLSVNTNLSGVKLVEYKRNRETNDVTRSVLHQLTKTNQTFANSKVDILYRRPNVKGVFNMTAIKKSPALLKDYMDNKLEVARYMSVGGEPWWETPR